MLVRAIRTRVFTEGEDLAAFVAAYVPKPKEGSIIAVTSKIVALAERRTAQPEELAALIRKESQWTMPAQYGIFRYLPNKAGIAC